MCGRFALSSLPIPLLEAFGLSGPKVRPRYNIAPGQWTPVILRDPERGETLLDSVFWGLTPFWMRERGRGFVNARAETAADKPSFRASFRHRRCLVPATGFYEWLREGRGKTPFYFCPAEPDRPLAFGGLWEDWSGVGETLRSFAILTTAANGTMSPIHDRMPVILEPESWERWLDPELQHPKTLAPFLAPAADSLLVCRQVSPFVNSVANDSPDCVSPVEDGQGLPFADRREK